MGDLNDLINISASGDLFKALIHMSLGALNTKNIVIGICMLISTLKSFVQIFYDKVFIREKNLILKTRFLDELGHFETFWSIRFF